MSTPALSVIMPVYNARHTALRAAQSVLNSTFRDFEFLILDDGSTDDTSQVLEALKDPRLQLIRLGHQGVAATANAAISRSRAPFIARMDADDLTTPDRFGNQLRHLQQQKADAVGGRVRVLDRLGKPVKTWERYQTWVNQHLDPSSISAFRFVESPLVNPTAMARREVFELGFRQGPWPEDYDFWLRAIQSGFRLAKLPDLVLDWTDHPDRLTRTHPAYSPEAFNRCRQMHLLNGPLRDLAQVDLWGAGLTGKPWLRWLLGQGYKVRRVIEVSPKKIGQTIHSVPVVPPESLTAPDGTPILIAVGASGAREQILRDLLRKGFCPGQDAWFVA